jgi:SAM-dependent methyltransferase
VTDSTIDFYELNARHYAELTWSADLSELRSRFLEQLPSGARILDGGCGAGRDLRAFREAGFVAEGIEPAPTLAHIAREFSGCPVRVAKIEELEDRAAFDGVWACASLLHLRRADLPRALDHIWRALRESGLLFLSVQKGTGEIVAADGRFYCLYQEDELLTMVRRAGFDPRSVWKSGDALPNRSSIRWINILARSSPLVTDKIKLDNEQGIAKESREGE